MRVFIPSLLHSYTKGQSALDASGADVTEVLRDLDARYPGLSFRIVDEQGCIREHIRFFRNGRMIRTTTELVEAGDTLHITAALSGG